jgi:hypothetical protein
MTIHIVRSAVVVTMLSFVGACGAGETGSKGGLEAHVRLSEQATAADVGLPTYPGSKPYKDADNSSAAANLGLSTPLFGFKVVAMNLETTDKPEQVAVFYRQALSKYGNVLECSDAADAKKKSQPGDGLKCDSNESGTHSVVYKVGTEENQRIVAIEPHAGGTRFALVHLDIRGEST